MKRLLLALVLCLLVGAVGAYTNDMQSSYDFIQNDTITHISGGGGSHTFSRTNSVSAGNSYSYAHASSYCDGSPYLYVTNPSGYPMTYAAATWLAGAGAFSMPASFSITMFDANFNQIGAGVNPNRNNYGSDKKLGFSIPMNTSVYPYPSRIEVTVVGGTAYFYANGTLIGNSTPMTVNPSYIGLSTGVGWQDCSISGWANIDDYVWGSTDPTTVIDMPDTGYYYLKKDIVNPAASGLYNASTGALISSTTFPITWSRSGLSGITNESVLLIYQSTGTTYSTKYTGYSTAGTASFALADIIDAGAPYGFYQVKIGTTVSDTIAYIANGANINFDRDEYAVGDTATTSYLIDGEYWDSSTYDYYIRIIDVYGTQISETAIASASGSTTYTWADDDTQGVYYAEIIGKPTAGGDEVLYNYDYATLSASFTVTGYVHDAETTLPISGAFVNASQGDTAANTTSGFDGNYTVSGFITGSTFGMNTTATGYQGYWNNFTPLYNHRINLNVTLLSTSPITTGITLGGVARDTTYGRPIPSVSVDIWNITDSQYWTATTNIVGFYNKTSVTENNVYNIEGMKTSYSNSTIYSKTGVRA